MTMNIDGLSAKELKALIAKAQDRHEKLESRTSVADVRRALAALAKEHGFTLDEVMGGGGRAPAAKRSGEKVAPKFRNPKTGETWSGRGRKAKWVEAELANGRKLVDFAI